MQHLGGQMLGGGEGFSHGVLEEGGAGRMNYLPLPEIQGFTIRNWFPPPLRSSSVETHLTFFAYLNQNKI